MGMNVNIEREQPRSFIKYSDGTYEYFCEANVGSARSSSVWQVLRKNVATGDLVYAGGGKYEHAATSAAVVGALSYTLGA